MGKIGEELDCGLGSVESLGEGSERVWGVSGQRYGRGGIGLKGHLGESVQGSGERGDWQRVEGRGGSGTGQLSACGPLVGTRGMHKVGSSVPLAWGLLQPLQTLQAASLLPGTGPRAKCWRPWGCLRPRSSTANMRQAR